MSIRLEQKPFELEGKTYILCCNMAVLDALQDAHDGDFGAVLELPVRQCTVEVLAAMLNDYAEEQGWEERWTPQALKRKFVYSYLLEQDIFGMFQRALIPKQTGDAEEQPRQQAPENAGN